MYHMLPHPGAAAAYAKPPRGPVQVSSDETDDLPRIVRREKGPQAVCAEACFGADPCASTIFFAA